MTNELNCKDCILDGTDACSRGAGRAVDDEICEDFLEERNCKECIHYVVDKEIAEQYSTCESWECDYQPRGNYVSKGKLIDAIDRIDWYHINEDGKLVHGANSKEDTPLYKAEDIYKAIENIFKEDIEE